MKTVLSCTLLTLLLLSDTTNVEGGDCARFGTYRIQQRHGYAVQSYATHQYVAPQQAVYVAPVVAVYVPLYTPTYNVTYDPTGGAAGLALLERLQSLENKVDRINVAPTVEPVAPGPIDPPTFLPRRKAPPPKALLPGSGPTLSGAKLFITKCASCHDGKKGGNPVLFDKGGLINRDGVPESIMQALRTGKMGKQKLPLLTDAQRLEMTYHLFDLPPPLMAKK